MKFSSGYRKEVSVFLFSALVAGSAFAVTNSATSIRGTVEKLLMNPEGDVDGFLLKNGTQVNFPPHMSKELVRIARVKGEVRVDGVQENERVFRAETIEDTHSHQSVTETPPGPPLDGDPLPPPPPGDFRNPPGPRDRLKKYSAQGKIVNRLFGPRGDVNGVVLADGIIIRFGPRVINETSVDTSIGQKLRASGYGTKNEFGESFEATDLSNN